MWCNLCRVEKPQNAPKSQKMTKNSKEIMHFLTLRSFKLGYPSGQGLLPTVYTDEKLLRLVSEVL